METVRATTLPHGTLTVLLNEAKGDRKNYQGGGLKSYETASRIFYIL